MGKLFLNLDIFFVKGDIEKQTNFYYFYYFYGSLGTIGTYYSYLHSMS